MTSRAIWGMAMAMWVLAACAEKPQAVSASKHDARAFEGVATAYTAAGWRAGDRASWEQQTAARAQGQNEYSRISAP